MNVMSKLLEKVFEKRGYTPDFLGIIENDYHRELLDMNLMIARLKEIHDNQSLLVILPDFDMDGITVGTLGFGGFAELEFDVALYIPDPHDGYGFNKLVIDKIIKQYPNVGSIITGDTGISCFEGIDYAKKCGIQVLITDHHLEKESYPIGFQRADVVVNPMRIDETYEHPFICGTYVLYQVLMAYAKSYGTVTDQEQIRRLIVLVGIGTVSDMMPLLYENRNVVRESVSMLRAIYMDGDPFVIQAIRGCDIYRRIFKGLFEVMHMFADNGKLPKGSFSITEDFYGFYLAPMFNSLKRMESDMTHAFSVFFGSNPYEEACYLYDVNQARKDSVVNYMNKLDLVPQPFADAGIFFTDAPSGICGLLAQRIIEQTGRPVFVVHETPEHHYAGSGRSPQWYPTLDLCVPAGFYLAGHNPAFGCGFTDKREINAFSAFIKKSVQDKIDALGEDYFDSLKSTYDLVISDDGQGDTPIDILAFVEFLHDLNRYQPFGSGFTKPRILLKFIPNHGAWSVMGGEKQHVKVILNYGFTVLLFNQADSYNLRESDEELWVDGVLDMSVWNSSHTVNFIGTIIQRSDN